MYGIVTPTGLALHHNGRSVELPVTSVTPMAVDVAAASSALSQQEFIGPLTPLGVRIRQECERQLAQIAARKAELAPLEREPEPCAVCGRMHCDCDEWYHWMNSDPHGDLSWRDDEELEFPYLIQDSTMQSETIGALAAALAKAQGEIQPRPDGPR